MTSPASIRPIRLAAGLVLLLAAGCSGGGDPAAAPTTTPQPTPAVEATHQKPEDLVGQTVCDDTVALVRDLGEADGGWTQWDEQQWFDWWDRVYDLGDLAVVAKTRQLQEAGRLVRDHPTSEVSDIVYPLFGLAAVCATSGLVDEDEFGDTIDAFLEGSNTN